MDQKTITIIIIFFIVLVLGMFGYAYLKKSEVEPVETMPETTTTSEADVPYPSITRIEGKHYFIDGVHTIVGEVAMPTPCDLLESSANVTPGTPDQVTFDFSVINNAETCVQTVTPQRFMVSATAPEDARINARFMGRDVELNLIPAAPGETPDEFELFIKG